MDDYRLTIKDGIITYVETLRTIGGEHEDEENILPDVEEIKGRLYIPKVVSGLDNEAFNVVNAEVIDADPENKTFYAKGNALYRRDDNSLVIGCKNTRIPDDGSVRKIGPFAFNIPFNLTEMELNPLVLPDSVRTIAYRAFAFLSDNDIHIVIPAAEELSLMSLMIYAPKCTFTIKGNPKMEAGVFGTKAEAADSNLQVYKELPELVYIKKDAITVICDKGSSVEAYCNKYGIPCKAE